MPTTHKVHSFRKKKVVEPQKFRFSAMRETALTCADALYKAIAKQNPNVDQDALEYDLRSLIIKHGLGETATVAPEVPEEALASMKAPYSLAGDILVIAYASAKEGKWRSAFQSFAEAMDAEDAEELFDGIATMNLNTEEAEAAAKMADVEASDDMNEEVQHSDIEDAMLQVASEMGDEEEDDLDTSSDIPDVRIPDDDEENEEDDEDILDSSAPMGGASSSKQLASMDARIRALANKMSITGTDKARQDGRRLVAKSKH